YVDDVDMWANTGNAKGEKRAPISGVTGQPISDEAWREYLAGFMQELRQAIPGYEIAHNNVWYAGGGAANRGTTAPVVRRQIEQADVLNLERGVRDSGLTGGSGSWSLYNVFTYIDEVHALGRAVKLGGGTYEPAAMEYNLAAYFLISTGRDYISDGSSSQNVKSFWSGWSVNLGDAIGPRERSPSGLWSRRFSNGVVYLLEPGAATQTISLPTTMKSATLGSVETGDGDWSRLSAGQRADGAARSSALLVGVFGHRHRLGRRGARDLAVQPRFDHHGECDPGDHVRGRGRAAVCPDRDSRQPA